MRIIGRKRFKVKVEKEGDFGKCMAVKCDNIGGGCLKECAPPVEGCVPTVVGCAPTVEECARTVESEPLFKEPQFIISGC